MLKRSGQILISASFDDFNKVQPTVENTARHQITGDDHEASLILKFIEDQCGKVELSEPRVDYRVYQIEDSSLMTSVYFDHSKEKNCEALNKLNKQIEEYVSKKF